MEFDRLKILIGDKIELFNNIKILLIGVGGVGGYVLESLVRSGFQNITIADYDTIDITNLNRQIITNQENIGKKKVVVAKERALSINPSANITIIDDFINKGFFENNNYQFDYIIDACDSVDTKAYLIRYAMDNNIKIISCMGTGNRLNPEKLKISKLSKTYNDPLAKKMRNLFKNTKYLNVPVVFSEELPIKHNNKNIGTVVVVPMTAGALCASFVINDILNKK
ncbi:MAG: ThiF family adenylyltransferase [Bacilli bacterium]|nr:ThiF family adenylyltransferase [Bacilli bacterium]